MLEAEAQRGAALEETLHKAVRGDSHLQRRDAGVVERRCAVLLPERENAEDATHGLAVGGVDALGDGADVTARPPCTSEELDGRGRCLRRPVIGMDRPATALAAQVLAQELASLGVESRTTRPPAQIGLAWLLARSPIMLPIPGTSRPEHLEENWGARTIQLEREEVESIAAAARAG